MPHLSPRPLLPLVFALAGLSCATVDTPARHAPTTAARPSAPVDPLPDLSEGRCGGLSELALAAPMPRLGDRLRPATLEGALDETRTTTERGATSSPRSWLHLLHEGHRLDLRVTELGRYATDDLLAAVEVHIESEDAAGHAVRLPREDELEMVVVALDPPEPTEDEREGDPQDRNVPVFDAYVRTADDLVVHMRFFFSAPAVAQGGCARVAQRIAGATHLGERQLELAAGERSLLPGVAVDLPAAHQIAMQDMHHWVEFHIRPIVALGVVAPDLYVRFDRHPGRATPSGPTRSVTAPAWGSPVEWREWTDARGGIWRDVILEEAHLLLAIVAPDPAMLEPLATIAASIGRRTPARARLSCDGVPAPPSAGEVESDEALRTLLEASRLATEAAVYGAARPLELDAFRAIAALPSDPRRQAFRHLAAHGTDAGRLYGLAGLYYADPANFRAFACAARGTLSGPVRRLDRCTAREVLAAELLESSDPAAIQLEPYWGDRQIPPGVSDLWGGALARQVWQAAASDAVSNLAGAGYVPTVGADAAAPRPLTAGPAPERPLLEVTTAGFCFTRADGRIACAGGAGPASQNAGRPEQPRPNVVLLPDMVRHPRDIAASRTEVCVLDVEGRRACVGRAMGFERGYYESACGVAPTDAQPYRVVDDGPWADLVVLSRVCGIRERDRALYCFATPSPHTGLPPFAADTLAPGQFGAYRVPIEGAVVGVGTGARDGEEIEYAFTDDGAVWTWNRESAPEVVAHFDAPVAWWAHVTGVDFAGLTDGAVYARGIAADADIESVGDSQAHPTFVEMPSLRGVRIASPHGSRPDACRRDDRGVSCWGPCAYDDAEASCQRERDRALRSATELLIETGMRCGRRSATRVSCMGSEVAWVAGPGVTHREFDLRALGRAAAERPVPYATP